MKSLGKIISITSLLLALQLVTTSPVFAQTSPWSGVCVSQTDETVATLQGFQCLLANVLSIFLTVVGIAAFIMLVMASFRLLVSGGNSQNVEKARNSVTYAVIGLVVAVSAFIILNLIADFTGVRTILEFKIPTSGSTTP